MKQSISDYKQSMYDFISPTATFIAICLILLALFSKGIIQVERIAFLDIVIVALASMRLIRLVCYDNIFRFVRESIAFKSRVVEEKGERYIEKTLVGVGYRRMLTNLLNCVWCVGMWTTLIAIVLYIVTPATALFVVLLAISGVATAFQLLVNLIGAKYEQIDAELSGTPDPKTK